MNRSLPAWLMAVALLPPLIHLHGFGPRELQALQSQWQQERRLAQQAVQRWHRLKAQVQMREQQPQAWPSRMAELDMRADELARSLAQHFPSVPLVLDWRHEPFITARKSTEPAVQAFELSLHAELTEVGVLEGLLEALHEPFIGMAQQLRHCRLHRREQRVEAECRHRLWFIPPPSLREQRPAPPLQNRPPALDAQDLEPSEGETVPIAQREVETVGPAPRIDAVIVQGADAWLVIDDQLVDRSHSRIEGMEASDSGVRLLLDNGKRYELRSGDPLPRALQ